MIARNLIARMGEMLFLALAALALACGSSKHAGASLPPGPCDVYASGGTPCVAAHSTVRALYKAYTGNLYQVRRSSDSSTQDVGVLSAGGYANAAAQDSFCSGTTCVISVIYDQSGRANDLTQAPPGGFNGPEADGYDKLANATAAPIIVNGNKVYGVYISPGTGYRNNNTNGVAKGDEPEGMYAVVDGTHYNDGCCFDYGNAETNSLDNGNGTMEAIYFGKIKIWGYGSGTGPWVMADLENGLYSGVNAGFNAGDPTVSYRYLTAIVKGEPSHLVIRAGDAQSSALSTFHDGGRPNVAGYDPAKKEGAILLGTGGDNSNNSAGTFYEGAMTSGFPSNATEDSLQDNIIAARYGKSAPSCTAVPPAPTNLQLTVVSSSQIDLSWPAVTPPATCWTTYSVFRNGTQVASDLNTTSYSDFGLSPATAYQYSVQAVDSVGSSANSATVSATTDVAGPISINVGGPVVGSFIPDGYSSGGLTYTNTATVTGPSDVPVEIYSTERYGDPTDTGMGGGAGAGSFTYALVGYTPYSAWTVTLYFAETFLTAAGQRLFGVSINGNKVMSEFDLYAAAGAVNIGIARSFPVTASSSGQFVIDFTRGSIENPKVNAISITSGASSDTEVPTAPGTPAASDLTSTSLSLSWEASSDNVGVTDYDIYDGPDLVGWSNTTSANVSKLVAGTTYSFTVRARDAAGNVSAASPVLSVTTLP